MSIVSCQSVEDHLQDLLDKRSSPVLHGEYLSHASECQNCQRTLSAFQTLAAWGPLFCATGRFSAASFVAPVAGRGKESVAVNEPWQSAMGRFAFLAAAALMTCLAWWAGKDTAPAHLGRPAAAQSMRPPLPQNGQEERGPTGASFADAKEYAVASHRKSYETAHFRTAAISSQLNAIATDPNLLLTPVRFGLTPVSESITSAMSFLKRSKDAQALEVSPSQIDHSKGAWMPSEITSQLCA